MCAIVYLIFLCVFICPIDRAVQTYRCAMCITIMMCSVHVCSGRWSDGKIWLFRFCVDRNETKWKSIGVECGEGIMREIKSMGILQQYIDTQSMWDNTMWNTNKLCVWDMAVAGIRTTGTTMWCWLLMWSLLIVRNEFLYLTCYN